MNETTHDPQPDTGPTPADGHRRRRASVVAAGVAVAAIVAGGAAGVSIRSSRAPPRA